MAGQQRQALPAFATARPNTISGDQDTCVIRADFTTGERRCRSAKRVALPLSVYTRPNFSPSA